jgi:uncharacterized protein YjbI with pentapeptide repeats
MGPPGSAVLDLHGIRVPGSRFAPGANLSDADLTGADLSGANLSRANLATARPC